jgi:hypothetical protein
LETLSKFAKEHIAKPICSAFRSEDTCDETEKAKIDSLKALSDSDFETLVTTARAELKTLVEEFETVQAPLMERQQTAVEAHEQKVDRILKEHHYDFLYQILRKRKLEEVQEGAGEEA